MVRNLGRALAISLILSAGVCPAQQASFTAGQKIEVREGDTWSAATIVRQEGRRYLIRYEGATEEEWVTTDRIRTGNSTGKASAAAPAVESSGWAPDQKVDVKRGNAWRAATVVKLQNGWVLVRYTLANFNEWVEPWRIRESGSKDDPIANAPMYPPATDGQAPPAQPPADSPIAAQGWREPKVGERVMVFEGSWTKVGILLERKDGQARVRLDDWPDPKGRTFKEEDIRVPGLKFEAKVGDRVRIHDGMWKSGTVAERQGDRVRVVIDRFENAMFHKWKTLEELRPPSDADLPPAAGAGSEALARTPGYKPADRSSAQRLALTLSGAKLTPDPALAASSPVQGVALRPSGDARPKSIVHARAAGTTVLFSQPIGRDFATFDRITAGGGSEAPAQVSAAVSKDMVLSDISPDGTKLLLRTSFHGDRIELWSLDASTARRQLLMFPHTVDRQPFREVASAIFVGNDRVLTTGGAGEMLLWNTATGKALYECPIARNSEPATSATGKYLAFTTGKEAMIIDAATGQAIIELPAPLAGATRFAFSPTGKQLLAADSTTIWAVNLNTGELHREFTIPGTVAISSIASPADGYALLNNSALIDLERRNPLWKYELPPNTVATTLPTGQLAYLLTTGAAPSLVTATVPHPAALKAAQATPEPDLLIKPGVSISVQVNVSASAEERAKIMQNITSQFEASGIRSAPGADLQLILSLDTGKTEQREYGSGPRMGPFARAPEKVTITQKISRIRIDYHGKTVWETTAVSADPGFMLMRQGNQTMQEAADAQSKPNMAIFSTVRLPAYMVMPRNPLYQGASELTVRGFRDKKPDPEPDRPATPPNAPITNTGLPTA